MPRTPSRSPRLLLAALLALAAARLPALSYVSVEAGRMLLGNPGTEGDVSPWLATAGAAIPVIEIGLFRFEVGALLWGTQYEYVEATGRLVPTQIETANQVGVLGLWVAPLAGVHVGLAGGRIELCGAAGLSLNFRFPLYETDLAKGEQATALAQGYRYFFAGRFLFPETRLTVRWLAFDDFSLSLSVTALYPVFHIWDKGAFLDQFVFGLIAGFDIRIPPKKAKASGGAPASGGGSP